MTSYPIGSYVYFIQAVDGGPIKIGYGADVTARLNGLQTGSPVTLRIIGICEGDRELEQKLHKELAAHHVRGEWFRPVPEVRDAMIRVRARKKSAVEVHRPWTDQLTSCTNCGFSLMVAEGLCGACLEFAALRESGEDPFAETAAA